MILHNNFSSTAGAENIYSFFILFEEFLWCKNALACQIELFIGQDSTAQQTHVCNIDEFRFGFPWIIRVFLGSICLNSKVRFEFFGGIVNEFLTFIMILFKALIDIIVTNSLQVITYQMLVQALIVEGPMHHAGYIRIHIFFVWCIRHQITL
ncbi:Hypothetical_protein [Hexamita inflata]|uniref:Hypothetical_protein n=1 Tax=Hexamita inflata TaxID=28002 RepID=A0AA86QV70_9EUKA|nr:Hypothetical protein HINF_LOCUS49751 [Hexamita inflata]